ncbi:MAG: (2Fe-2S)-binding protein [Myxococcales bacterium]|nr:(2Fe-2S)-binding protein [Myxococcales bacterium]MCB9709524.1 (2Fe-2S)-binding protein [Myxococcales bacterium]
MFIILLEPDAIEIRAHAGERLLDLMDGLPKKPIGFECRSATCGSCRVKIIGDGHQIVPPSQTETQTLKALGYSSSRDRLACQLRIAANTGRLRLRTHPPWHESA